MPLPYILIEGKMNRLDGFQLVPLPNGRVRIHYGCLFGHQTVASMAEVKAVVNPWLDKREAEANKTLKDIAAIRKALNGPRSTLDQQDPL